MYDVFATEMMRINYSTVSLTDVGPKGSSSSLDYKETDICPLWWSIQIKHGSGTDSNL